MDCAIKTVGNYIHQHDTKEVKENIQTQIDKSNPNSRDTSPEKTSFIDNPLELQTERIHDKKSAYELEFGECHGHKHLIKQPPLKINKIKNNRDESPEGWS